MRTFVCLTSQNSVITKFAEFPFHALRCIRTKERRERPRYRRMEAGMREAMDLLEEVANALR